MCVHVCVCVCVCVRVSVCVCVHVRVIHESLSSLHKNSLSGVTVLACILVRHFTESTLSGSYFVHGKYMYISMRD